VGLFVVNDWDLLVPLSISATEFEQWRSRMKGFSETLKSYSFDAVNLSGEDIEVELVKRVTRNLSVFVVQGPGLKELMFAGLIRKGFSEEKALITISIDR
jgi:hypothetical protein